MRNDWDKYFMEIAEKVKSRSTCPRLQVGAVITKNNYIKATGYNGSPPGLVHCTEVGCLMINNHCRRTIHAEVNAVMNTSPIDLQGATIYVTARPCMECSKVILAAGITRVVFGKDYPQEYDFFKDSPKVIVHLLEQEEDLKC